MKTKLLFVSMLLLGLSLTSCYKATEDATLEEYDITLTYYDPGFDFQTYQTFVVRDSVMLVSDYLTDEEKANFYREGTSDDIRSKIVNGLLDLGYTQVSEDNNPDMMINPIVTLVKEVGVTYYPGWWWGYGGYWGWYGGWYYKSTSYYPYYGGYYPYWGASYYTYKTGTLIVEMADGNSVREYRDWLEENGEDGDPNTAPKIEFNWTAHIEGLMASNSNYNVSRAEQGISEAFAQSPYLKK
ncbi:MAG: DUF4136 domain-containing protein [Bacteroidales bacterium]|nr:DUF4136 domain-containing protein [Bacteroidales bacterium]